MGWSITITSDKEITEQEIDSLIAEIPEELKAIFPGHEKQSWGWAMATDINMPQGNKMSIRGSYGISGNKAELMRDWLKSELKKNGHKIRCSKFE